MRQARIIDLLICLALLAGCSEQAEPKAIGGLEQQEPIMQDFKLKDAVRTHREVTDQSSGQMKSIMQTYVPDGDAVVNLDTDPRICELVEQASAKAVSVGWEAEDVHTLCQFWSGRILDDSSARSFWHLSVGPTKDGIHIAIRYNDFG